MTDPIILEAILEYLQKHRSPLRAIRNLKVALTRNRNMGTFTLKWTDPTSRENGLPGVTDHVEVYQEPNSTTPIASVPGGAQTFTTLDLTPGDYSFVVIAVDATGLKSSPSNIGTGTIPTVASPLRAITDLSVALNA